MRKKRQLDGLWNIRYEYNYTNNKKLRNRFQKLKCTQFHASIPFSFFLFPHAAYRLHFWSDLHAQWLDSRGVQNFHIHFIRSTETAVQHRYLNLSDLQRESFDIIEPSTVNYTPNVKIQT